MYHQHLSPFQMEMLNALKDEDFAEMVCEILDEHLADSHELASGIASNPTTHGHLHHHGFHRTHPHRRMHDTYISPMHDKDMPEHDTRVHTHKTI